MIQRTSVHLLAMVAIFVTIGLVGCSDDDSGLGPAPFPTNNEVFIDEFGSSVTFQAFLGSKLDAVQTDQSTTYQGSLSLIITVPDSGDASGSYAGGAFTAGIARDLTEYNALTFWAKASTDATLNVAGIGNDNTGTSKYTAEVTNLALTTSWQKFVIPIPLSEKLNAEQGLFYFAEGPEDGVGNTIWFDEIQFEQLSTVTNPRPALTTQTIDVESGGIVNVGNPVVTFDVIGTDLNVSAMPGYFTFTSSNTGIVTDGIISGAGVGSATLTATLGAVAATGTITVNVITPQAVPLTAAPTPTVDAADVVSLFSDAYTDETVDRWSTDWDVTDLSDELIGGNNVKKYFNLAFAGIEFSASPIDASSMTYFHMDIWTPSAVSNTSEFTIKLVDFGANGVFGGGDDAEHELAFTDASAPALATESWVSIDLPLAAFSGLTTTGHLAQMILSGNLSTVYVDNIYFYDGGQPTTPRISAPTPMIDADVVISLFSDAYTDVTVDTWSAVWDQADVEDYAIGSDNTKLYTNFSFAGIVFRNVTIDATAMTHFHIDIWTPEATASQSRFKINLVDLGPDGVYGGDDDIGHEITLDRGTISTSLWVSMDIPLSDFTGLITKEHLGQLIISGDISTAYVDNIYFYDSGIPTIPPAPAPTPTLDAADVISLFSDAYTDVPVDTWSAVWDSAGVQDFLIGSDNTKKYITLLFAGIEFKTTTVDASAMTHFHMDVWTPDPTGSPAVFEIKLVDFGADGVFDGSDNVEHEITLDESNMNSNSWVSLDIPLTDFVNLTTKGHLAQLIISGDPNTVYVDNIYFHK
jgi:hypothetical protein